jgi:predicted TPR repeat methyltransferase
MSFDQARAAFLQGLACWEAGNAAQAEAHYLHALALLPGRASTLINLAAAQLALGKPQDALAHADQALAAEPAATDALLHRAHALAQLGRAAEALASLDTLLAAAPQHAAAWSSRGSLLREAGRLDEAALAFRQALVAGGDATLNAYYLAAVTGQSADTPQQSPAGYVQALFDSYADGFEQHLVSDLHYQVPQQLLQALPAAQAPVNVLDLGCGTGLAGPLLRPRARRLVGLDLSAAMLARAQATGAYDRLVQADAATWLADTDERFDLVLAADLLIYVGALDTLLAALRRVLQPGGWLALSIESPALPCPAGWCLQPSLRYAHDLAYLHTAALRHGLAPASTVATPLREEQGRPVPGHLVLLRA